MEAKSKVQKSESDEEDSGFECYNKSDGKLVHVDVDNEITERDTTLALLPNRSVEEEINNYSEARVGNGNISVLRSNRIFKPPERLGTVPFF